MIYEVAVGGLAGLVTYLYLYHLHKTSAAKELKQRQENLAVQNATEHSSKAESMEWLNFIIKQWYLYSAGKLEDLIKSIAKPLLANMDLPSAISGVELETFTFGQSPPYVEYVKVIRDTREEDPNLQSLKLALGPRIKAPAFEVKLNMKGMGRVILRNVEFEGELQMVLLLDKTLPFPGIRHVYFSLQKRPEIHFDVNYGLVGMDSIPFIKKLILDKIEEIVSDTLVDPGRYLMDLSKEPAEAILITGVRKLKRTALNLKVDLQAINASVSTKGKKIYCTLSTGGNDYKSSVKFSSDPKTLNIWFPLAVLQQEITLTVKEDIKYKIDETLAEVKVDLDHLTRDVPLELSRVKSDERNIELAVTATAFELPYIPIRQDADGVHDFSEYFKTPETNMSHTDSGLVYIHLHRATGLPIKDKRTNSSDPFCTVKVNDEKLFKTKVVSQNLNPIFNHFEDFFVTNFNNTGVAISVRDHNTLNSSDDIGSVSLNLRDVVPKTVNKSFTIRDNKHRSVGKIYMTIMFRPIELAARSWVVENFLVNNLGDITSVN